MCTVCLILVLTLNTIWRISNAVNTLKKAKIHFNVNGNWNRNKRKENLNRSGFFLIFISICTVSWDLIMFTPLPTPLRSTPSSLPANFVSLWFFSPIKASLCCSYSHGCVAFYYYYSAKESIKWTPGELSLSSIDQLISQPLVEKHWRDD